MCGIAGIVAAGHCEGLALVAEAMSNRLQHRGPDDHGWLTYGRDCVARGQGRPDDGPVEVVLVHRRLSILDLSEAGRQPMSTHDGRFHIVLNGEVYNYVELREELASAGMRFHTKTDTEVLLAALAHWGVAALPRLVGMFAFALLDTQERTVLLARDFFGIKPLYYAWKEGRLAFTSEIKALLELAWVPRRVNPRTLYYYLAHGQADYGPETLLADVHQLAPAHYLRIPLDSPAEPVPTQYWTVDMSRAADVSFDEAAQRLRELFLQSVRLHLRSDVPVGTALSGGIDSSSILMGVRAAGHRTLDFHSFSFLAGDPAIDEERWVDLASSSAHTTVHKVRVQPEELCADLDQLIRTQDEPFASTSIYAQYRVFRAARQSGVKVLLDGQGGDELLAGYWEYLLWLGASLLRQGRLLRATTLMHKAPKRPGIGSAGMFSRACLRLAPRGVRNAVRRRGGDTSWINHSWFLDQGTADDGPLPPATPVSLRTRLWDDLRSTSLPTLLRYEDRNSMAFSIESRVPLLTPQLVEFVFSLPDSYLISRGGLGKHVFREAMRGIVPDAILDRREKIGFETPELAWLQAARSWVGRVLESDTARTIPAWHYDRLLNQAESMLAGGRPFDGRLWRWLNLTRWSELFEVRYP